MVCALDFVYLPPMDDQIINPQSAEWDIADELSTGEELYEHYRIIADAGQGLLRIDKFLVSRIERATRSKIQLAIDAGSVLVHDKPVKANYKVRPFDVITIVLPRPPSDGTVKPEPIPLDIRFEDEHLLVLYKPAGMVVHPGIGVHSGTLVNALAYYLAHSLIPILPGNSPDRPGLVHRIDKETSGLLVIAKSDFAMSHLAKQFFNHTIERKYCALVWGEPPADEGTIRTNIGRHPRSRMEMTVFPEGGEQGKVAVTHYKVLERLYYVSLVECELETGRTHQIRVHMKHLGNTLFNDDRYGGDRILKGTIYTKYKQFVENTFEVLPRLGLHARSLGFVHPVTQEKMYFDTPLPDDMTQCLERWRKYVSTRREKLEDE